VSGPGLRHRAEYLGFRLLRGGFRLVPRPLALLLGEVVGWMGGAVLRIRRRVVDENLRLAFPDRSARWRRRTARASYRHLGREAVMVFRGSGREELIRMTEIEGLEPVRERIAAGKGVLVVTGHLGNWELGGAALAARGIPVAAVALAQANPLFDRDLSEARSRLGMGMIQRGRAPREVLEALAEGRVAALVGDQNARASGVFVDFFGRPASTYRGPALFAIRTGSPLFLGVGMRVSRHPLRYRIVLEEVEVSRSGDLDDDVRRLTARHVAALERWVRAEPEQYFWQHQRWRTRPTGRSEGGGDGTPGDGREEPEPPPPV
jgi:KDO2-lipid IV(A) lauroyltransferase